LLLRILNFDQDHPKTVPCPEAVPPGQMHQHPRPPPVTASPANSEQTNPTRTNNPRDRDSSTQGLGSGEDFSSPGKNVAPPNPATEISRLNQVIQVRSMLTAFMGQMLMSLGAEFPYQSCPDHSTLQSRPCSCLQERF
jgi:hypothetical protein